MPLTIPTKTDGTQAYGVTVPLDGVAYRFDFAWNARGQYWTALVSDSAGNPLVRRAVRIGTLFFARFRALNLTGYPSGEVLVLDTSNQDLDPGLTDLGARVQLTYLSADEIAAAAAAP